MAWAFFSFPRQLPADDGEVTRLALIVHRLFGSVAFSQKFVVVIEDI
jgi:hypothetical protein